MKLKSFGFGVGCGLFFLSALLFFAYAQKINANGNPRRESLTDDEIKTRARHLGMVLISENAQSAKLADDEVVSRARDLGMVFLSEANSEKPGISPAAETDSQSSDSEPAQDKPSDADTDGAQTSAPAAPPSAQETAPLSAAQTAQDSAADANAPKSAAPPANAAQTAPASAAPAAPPANADNQTNDAAEPPEQTAVSTAAQDGKTSHEQTDGAADGVSDAANAETVTVTIRNGYTASQIATVLLNAGVISDYGAFMDCIIKNGAASRLTIGTYTFSKNEDYEAIINKIKR